MGLASESLRLVRFAGFLGAALSGLQLLESRLHTFAAMRRRLQFAQLDFDALPSALQLPLVGILMGLEGLQLMPDLGGLFLQGGSALRQLAGLRFP